MTDNGDEVKDTRGIVGFRRRSRYLTRCSSGAGLRSRFNSRPLQGRCFSTPRGKDPALRPEVTPMFYRGLLGTPSAHFVPRYKAQRESLGNVWVNHASHPRTTTSASFDHNFVFTTQIATPSTASCLLEVYYPFLVHNYESLPVAHRCHCTVFALRQRFSTKSRARARISLMIGATISRCWMSSSVTFSMRRSVSSPVACGTHSFLPRV